MEHRRFEEIYREKALMNGGLRVGGIAVQGEGRKGSHCLKRNGKYRVGEKTLKGKKAKKRSCKHFVGPKKSKSKKRGGGYSDEGYYPEMAMMEHQMVPMHHEMMGAGRYRTCLPGNLIKREGSTVRRCAKYEIHGKPAKKKSCNPWVIFLRQIVKDIGDPNYTYADALRDEEVQKEYKRYKAEGFLAKPTRACARRMKK